MTKGDDYPGLLHVPRRKGATRYLRRRRVKGIVVLMEKHDAMTLLKEVNGQTVDTVKASHCFFRGPFSLTDEVPIDACRTLAGGRRTQPRVGDSRTSTNP